MSEEKELPWPGDFDPDFVYVFVYDCENAYCDQIPREVQRVCGRRSGIGDRLPLPPPLSKTRANPFADPVSKTGALPFEFSSTSSDSLSNPFAVSACVFANVSDPVYVFAIVYEYVSATVFNFVFGFVYACVCALVYDSVFELADEIDWRNECVF